MRIVAVLSLLSLTACPTADCAPGAASSRAMPEFGVVVPGEPRLATGGGEVSLGSSREGCWSTDTLRLRNVGRGSGSVLLSPPTARFQYDAGPHFLAPGEELALDVRIDASGELPEDGVLRHELRLESRVEQCPEPTNGTFTLTSKLFSASIERPRLDFGAVVLGESKVVEMKNVSGLSGDFSHEGDQVRFSPTREGPYRTVADWKYDERCVPLWVPVLGDGVVTPFGQSASSVSFGDTPVGTLAEREVEFEVWTTDRPTVAFSLPTSPDFSVVERWAESTVPLRSEGGLIPARHVVTVQFRPSQSGAQSGTLVISLGGQQRAIALGGVGSP